MTTKNMYVFCMNVMSFNVTEFMKLYVRFTRSWKAQHVASFTLIVTALSAWLSFWTTQVQVPPPSMSLPHLQSSIPDIVT